MIDAFMQTKLS